MSAEYPHFSLRFPLDEVEHWASLYRYQSDEHIRQEIVPRVREAGHFTKDDFVALCRWKTPRQLRNYESNPEDFIKEVTRVAFSTSHERLRIEVLTLLKGVEMRVASALLHFAHIDPYPILDFRAVWSLNIDEPQYNFEFWSAYTRECRRLAQVSGVTIRTLDQALWQYAKEHQPPL